MLFPLETLLQLMVISSSMPFFMRFKRTVCSIDGLIIVVLFLGVAELHGSAKPVDKFLPDLDILSKQKPLKYLSLHHKGAVIVHCEKDL